MTPGADRTNLHVAPAGRVAQIQDSENNRKLTFELPDDKWVKYILPKVHILIGWGDEDMSSIFLEWKMRVSNLPKKCDTQPCYE